MKYLTLKEAENILLKKINSDDVGIHKDCTKEFQWGYLFLINTKEYIETGKNPMYGNGPILIDRIDGTIHSIFDGYSDKKLEEYREKKGYPHVIKFPVKGDFSKMTDLEKVFALMETNEIVQVEKAIKIVKEKELFDIEGLGKLCNSYQFDNLTEAIAVFFKGINGELVFHESPLKIIPKEITLFKDKITSLFINLSELEEIPEAILELRKLTSIVVDFTPIQKIPFDLRQLKNLRRIELERTKIKPEDAVKFKLPEGCELIIKGEFDYKKFLNSYKYFE